MNLKQHKKVQTIAKDVLLELGNQINAEATEESIATLATELLAKYSVVDTWYYDVPAFVLLGNRSCLSISGKDYSPARERVGATNIVTVDLSPCIEQFWGDCARTYCIENGKHTPNPEYKDFAQGLWAQNELHRSMLAFVSPGTMFSELFHHGNAMIHDLGFENLDFLSNLGHSIECSMIERRYIDANCTEKLGDSPLFAFEPHIRKIGGQWGFKHENIYYFNEEGEAIEL